MNVHFLHVPGMAWRRLSTVCKWSWLYHIQWHCRVHHIRVRKAQAESKYHYPSRLSLLLCFSDCVEGWLVLVTTWDLIISFMAQLFKMEDVSMGMWVEKFNSSRPVEYVHSVKFCQFGCIDDYFTAHYQSPRQMTCMWGKLQQHGKPQCCNMRWQAMQPTPTK